MFTRAIEVDPGYARAYAGVADCCSILYMYFDARASNLKQADKASLKALQLDPDLAEAHSSRGLAFSLSKEYDKAAEEFETAMKLDPKLYEAPYFYGRACIAQGKSTEAVPLFELACKLRPEDYQAPSFLAQAFAGQGRIAEANKESKDGSTRIPTMHVLSILAQESGRTSVRQRKRSSGQNAHSTSILKILNSFITLRACTRSKE
jgi:tetratricopeptide (TPR) repeat protein